MHKRLYEATLQALPCVLVCVPAAMLTATPAYADDDELPFAEAQLLLQLNDTDGDLGFHGRIDGDPWKRLIIESPSERTLLDVRLRGPLRRQGLTEFRFESAEPTFDELDPEQFFRRFPEGVYEVEGQGFDGVEYESEAYLSHLIPAAPDELTVSGVPAPEDCDGAIPVATDPVTIAWAPVDSSHAELGRPGEVEVEGYELDVEGETVDYSIKLDAEITSVTLAPGALPSGETVKYQVLVIEAGGNESSSESCFIAP